MKEFTREQRNFVENLKLILKKKGWKNKDLAEKVDGLQTTNLSAALHLRNAFCDDMAQSIADALEENMEDMNREGYAKKKYYTVDDIDVMEMLSKTPYNDALIKLFIYYAVAFSISAGIASLLNHSAVAVFFCVSINTAIVLMSPVMNKYVKVEKSKIRSVSDNFVKSHRLLMMIGMSLVEMLFSSPEFYENNMMLLLLFIFFDSSGIYSLSFMKQKENKMGLFYYISLVIFKAVFIYFIYLYFSNAYNTICSFWNR